MKISISKFFNFFLTIQSRLRLSFFTPGRTLNTYQIIKINFNIFEILLTFIAVGTITFFKSTPNITLSK